MENKIREAKKQLVLSLVMFIVVVILLALVFEAFKYKCPDVKKEIWELELFIAFVIGILEVPNIATQVKKIRRFKKIKQHFDEADSDY